MASSVTPNNDKELGAQFNLRPIDELTLIKQGRLEIATNAPNGSLGADGTDSSSSSPSSSSSSSLLVSVPNWAPCTLSVQLDAKREWAQIEWHTEHEQPGHSGRAQLRLIRPSQSVWCAVDLHPQLIRQFQLRIPRTDTDESLLFRSPDEEVHREWIQAFNELSQMARSNGEEEVEKEALSRATVMMEDKVAETSQQSGLVEMEAVRFHIDVEDEGNHLKKSTNTKVLAKPSLLPDDDLHEEQDVVGDLSPSHHRTRSSTVMPVLRSFHFRSASQSNPGGHRAPSHSRSRSSASNFISVHASQHDIEDDMLALESHPNFDRIVSTASGTEEEVNTLRDLLQQIESGQSGEVEDMEMPPAVDGAPQLPSPSSLRRPISTSHRSTANASAEDGAAPPPLQRLVTRMRSELDIVRSQRDLLSQQSSISQTKPVPGQPSDTVSMAAVQPVSESTTVPQASTTPATNAAAARSGSAKSQWLSSIDLFLSFSPHHVWWIIVFLINIPLYRLAESGNFPTNQSTSVLALIFFLLGVVIRNEQFVMFVYYSLAWTFVFVKRFAKQVNWFQTPSMRTRTVLLNIEYYLWSMVHYIGGAHVAYGVSGLAWTVYYYDKELRPYLEKDDPRIVTLFCIWSVIGCSITSALPPIRFFLHNTFETAHRLSGWSLLGLLALHISFSYWKQEATAKAVFNSPGFWIVGFLLFLAVFPWVRQEYTRVSIDVPLVVMDAKAEAEAARRGQSRRSAAAVPNHPNLRPGLGMIMTLKDGQFGSFLGLGTAQPGTGTRFSTNNWEFHSFISVSTAPGLRQIQAMFEEYMHANAQTEVAMAREEIAILQQQLEDSPKSSSAEETQRTEEELKKLSASLAESEKALSFTSTGAEFLAKHKLGEVYHNLIARAGDWTGRLMDEAVRNGVLLHDFYGPRIRYERMLHARRYKAPGFGLTASLYNRVLVVASGGGVAGALPYAFRHLNQTQLRERRKKEWDHLAQQMAEANNGINDPSSASSPRDILLHRQRSFWSHSTDRVKENVQNIRQLVDQSKGKPTDPLNPLSMPASPTNNPLTPSMSPSPTAGAVPLYSPSNHNESSVMVPIDGGIGGDAVGFDPPNYAPEDPLSSACPLDPGAANIGFCHVLWVCRSPALMYREMYEALASLPPSQFTVIDTAEINSALVAKFLPQLCVSLTYAHQCEAVCIVSGPQLSNSIVKVARNHYIPAYQATFDS